MKGGLFGPELLVLATFMLDTLPSEPMVAAAAHSCSRGLLCEAAGSGVAVTVFGSVALGCSTGIANLGLGSCGE